MTPPQDRMLTAEEIADISNPQSQAWQAPDCEPFSTRPTVTRSRFRIAAIYANLCALSYARDESAHAHHGRGSEEDGPDESDCPCRGTPLEEACADEGCGFCRATAKVFTVDSDPVCTRCLDRHSVRSVEEDVAPRACTHCPVPCPKCRGHLSAFCASTPCFCDCHQNDAQARWLAEHNYGARGVEVLKRAADIDETLASDVHLHDKRRNTIDLMTRAGYVIAHASHDPNRVYEAQLVLKDINAYVKAHTERTRIKVHLLKDRDATSTSRSKRYGASVDGKQLVDTHGRPRHFETAGAAGAAARLHCALSTAIGEKDAG